jgi:uncharacterized protein (DUF302 family)
MRYFFSILTVLLVTAACAPPQPSAPVNPVVRYSTDGKFDNVRDDLERAILAKGLVIDNTSFIAGMLDRTGKDVGSTKAIYADGQGQAFSFCSAVVSRKTMEADAHNIAFCPYAIVVYSTAAEPKKVHVAYRRALTDIETLLDDIVREALRIKNEKKK